MEEINLKDLFSYFFSKIAIMIVVTLLVVFGSCIYALFFQKSLYSSYTTLVLTRASDGSNDSSITQNDITLNQKLVSTYRVIIKSRRIINQVIDNLKLDYTVAELSSRINVTTESDTELIRISVTDEDPALARDIADEIASVFGKEIIEIYSIQNVSVIDYAEEAVNPYNVNIIKQTLIALAAGIVLSCGIIFAMFYFDTTIISTEEVEQKIGLPVLGAVPKSNYLKNNNKKKSGSKQNISKGETR